MSKQIPFEEITEDMVLEECRRRHNNLVFGNFQHFEVVEAEGPYEEQGTESGEKVHQFFVNTMENNDHDSMNLNRWAIALIEREGAFLGYYLSDLYHWEDTPKW